MTLEINIKNLSRVGPDFESWFSGLEKERENLIRNQAFISDLLDLLNDSGKSGFVRAKAAYVAAKLGVKEAIEVFANHLGENWAPFSISILRHHFDPQFALVEYGDAAIPHIKKFLSETNNSQSFLTGTVILYNLTGDKNEVRQILEPIIKGRPRQDASIFEATLKGLEEWK